MCAESSADKAAELAEARARLNAKRQRLIDLYVSGIIDRSEFDSRIADVARELDGLKEDPVPRADPAVIGRLAGDLESYWPSLTAEERRAVIGAAAPRITVWSGRYPRCEIDSPLTAETLHATLQEYRPKVRY